MKRIRVGDISLHLVDQGHGPVILLVHGFPLDHTMWGGQIAAFSDSFRVIAPDLRGFGKSGVTAGTVTMTQMAIDLAMMLDALDVNEPICFCGLSMGGYVGWQFWNDFSSRLARLIVCDTRAVADTKEVARGRQLMAQTIELEGTARVAESLLPKLFAPVTLAEQVELATATRNVIVKTNPAGLAAAQRGMADRPDMSGHLNKILMPTLVVCGEHDAISGTAEMRQIAAAIPRAQFVEIRGAGHMAPLERPNEFNRAIRAFLEVPW